MFLQQAEFDAIKLRVPESDPNNLNNQLICYANETSLKQIGFQKCGYAILDNHHLVLVLHKNISENCIEVPDSIKVDKQVVIYNALNISPQFSMRPISEEYKFMPKIEIAKSGTLKILKNCNAKFATSQFLKIVLQKPFIGQQGKVYKINLLDPKLVENLIKNKNNLSSFSLEKRKIEKLQNQGKDTQKLKDVYIYFEIEDISKYTIIDLQKMTINLKYENQFKPQSKLDTSNTFKQVYKSGPFNEFKKQLENIIKQKQFVVSILIETNKNLGKRTLFKGLSLKYGLNYCEKDIGAITSEKQLNLFLDQSIEINPSFIFIRNVEQIKQLIALKFYQDIEKQAEQNLINLIQRSKKQFSLQTIIVYCVDSLQNYQFLKTQVDHIIKFKPNNYEDIAKIFNVKTCKGINWRTLEKGLQQYDSYEQCIEKLKQKNNLQTIVNVKQEDVGGMEESIREVSKTVILPQQFPNVFDDLVKPRRGVLFYGPPGTGKTLLAKCIANECNMNFISVKGPEMLNMYIGESEKNIRDLFIKARENSPCIIFFDELDALAPARGNNSDSNQVMDRIVAQFLTELDQIDTGVFIIGATNRPDLLDQSLLRPGRFDKLLYLGIQSDDSSRLKILKAQTRNLNIDPNLDLLSVIQETPKNFTGADFFGVTSQAIQFAAKREIQRIEEKYEQEKEENEQFKEFIERIETKIVLQLEDFQQSLKVCKASVKESDLKKYEELKNQFS